MITSKRDHPFVQNHSSDISSSNSGMSRKYSSGDNEQREINPFTSVVTPNVKVGIKPMPHTSMLAKTDRALVQGLISSGYDCVVLPVTNAQYKANCKDYFLHFKENSIQQFNSLQKSSVLSTRQSENVVTQVSSQTSTSINDIDKTMYDDNDGSDEALVSQAYRSNILEAPYPKLSEVNVVTGPHIANTIGLLSSWVEFDSDDELINEFSLQVINNEASYAQYVGIKVLLIAPPKNLKHLQIYADNLNTILQRYNDLEISISLPMCEDTMRDPTTGDPIPMIDSLSTWDVWNSIRIQCNYNQHLTVSLGSPKTNIPQGVVERWLLEPVRFYLLSSNRFIPNSKRYPVLNKFNQLIIWKLIQRKALNPPVLILHGVDRTGSFATPSHSHASSIADSNKYTDTKSAEFIIQGKHVSLGDLSYLDYLRYLISTSYKNNQLAPLMNFTLNSLLKSSLSKERLTSPDSLQTPLAPVSTNLDNNTYKVFEQDRAKYDAYQEAITKALSDLISLKAFKHLAVDQSQLTQSSGTNEWEFGHKKLKILVIGPGRGPLLGRLFNTIDTLHLNRNFISVVAVEKNPNVMIYLNERNREQWDNAVSIYNCDIRSWHPQCHYESNFNLVISELLGSFGCNELAPECLDAVSNLCDPETCISIPTEFTSYIAPAISPIMYSKVCRKTDPGRFDKPYLPMWDELDVLSSRYAKAWTFQCLHTRGNNCQNKRRVHATLKCHKKGVIHGLIGFFSAVLYKDVILSTCPTGDGPIPSRLVSWLPMFFPIEQPIYITDDQELSVFIKRECNKDRVWYEWSMEAFMYLLLSGETDGDHEAGSQLRVRTAITRVHNANGDHFSMLLR